MALKTNLFGAPAANAATVTTTTTSAKAAASVAETASAGAPAPAAETASVPQATIPEPTPLTKPEVKDGHGNVLTVGSIVTYKGHTFNVEEIFSNGNVHLVGGNKFMPMHMMDAKGSETYIVVRNNNEAPSDSPKGEGQNVPTPTETAPAETPSAKAAASVAETPSAGASAPAAETPQQPAPQQPSPAANRKADTKKDKRDKKHDYVAPKDAAEAKQRIVQLIDSRSITMERDEQVIRFYGNTSRVRDSFRLLGGEWTANKDTNEYFWTVPTASWMDPSTATATKSEAQQRREQAAADAQRIPADSIAALRNRATEVLGEMFNEQFTLDLIRRIFSDAVAATDVTTSDVA